MTTVALKVSGGGAGLRVRNMKAEVGRSPPGGRKELPALQG